MSREVTLTITEYDRVRPLKMGEFSPDSFDLSVNHHRAGDLFPHVAGESAQFDVVEMSLSTYTLWKSSGDCPYSAIPVFPSRFFRHGSIYVNTDAGIETPGDLVGRRVGIRTEYQSTAPLWVRGILEHEYGVPPTEMEWYTSREEKYPIDLPDNIDKTVTPPEKNLHEMTAAGELDALVSCSIPNSLGTSIERMFPNFKQIEQEYYRKTGNFPPMHTLLIRNDLHEADPTIASTMYDLMVQAKQITLERLYNGCVLYAAVPWLVDHLEETRNVLGKDYWPYGFDRNRSELEAITQYSYEQGLSARKMEPEELFVDDLLDT